MMLPRVAELRMRSQSKSVASRTALNVAEPGLIPGTTQTP